MLLVRFHGYAQNPTKLGQFFSSGNIMQLSLLDIAVKTSGETPENYDVSDKRTLIFVGSKSSGKTTIIQRFLEKNDPIKETLALEYSFGRKSGRSLTKDICHIWELGGGVLFSTLLPYVFGSNTKETSLLVVLDLTSPTTIWLTLETLLQTVHNHLKGDEKLITAARSRVPDDHPDKETIMPFPVPLVLIGGKYDLFLNMDPEEKKLISRTLRLVAHSLAASVVFYSEKDPNLVKKMKDLLNYHGFGGAPWKTHTVEANKPISVPFGYDSFEQIANTLSLTGGAVGLGLERFKHLYTSQFPQESGASAIPNDPAHDSNFKEPMIDQLRSHKDEELDRFLQEIENKRKLAAINN